MKWEGGSGEKEAGEGSGWRKLGGRSEGEEKGRKKLGGGCWEEKV